MVRGKRGVTKCGGRWRACWRGAVGLKALLPPRRVRRATEAEGVRFTLVRRLPVHAAGDCRERRQFALATGNPVVHSIPETQDRIQPDLVIPADECEALADRLGDEDAVERILVVRRKSRDLVDVRERDREQR